MGSDGAPVLAPPPCPVEAPGATAFLTPGVPGAPALAPGFPASRADDADACCVLPAAVPCPAEACGRAGRCPPVAEYRCGAAEPPILICRGLWVPAEPRCYGSPRNPDAPDARGLPSRRHAPPGAGPARSARLPCWNGLPSRAGRPVRAACCRSSLHPDPLHTPVPAAYGRVRAPIALIVTDVRRLSVYTLEPATSSSAIVARNRAVGRLPQPFSNRIAQPLTDGGRTRNGKPGVAAEAGTPAERQPMRPGPPCPSSPAEAPRHPAWRRGRRRAPRRARSRSRSGRTGSRA